MSLQEAASFYGDYSDLLKELHEFYEIENSSDILVADEFDLEKSSPHKL